MSQRLEMSRKKMTFFCEMPNDRIGAKTTVFTAEILP